MAIGIYIKAIWPSHLVKAAWSLCDFWQAFDPEMYCTMVWGSSDYIGSQTFLSNWTSHFDLYGWPWRTLCDLWLQQWVTFWWNILHQLVAIGDSWTIWLLVDPQMTLVWPLTSIFVLHSSQGFWWPNLGAIRLFNLLLTPPWPLTQECIRLWARPLLTKFGCHRAF